MPNPPQPQGSFQCFPALTASAQCRVNVMKTPPPPLSREHSRGYGSSIAFGSGSRRTRCCWCLDGGKTEIVIRPRGSKGRRRQCAVTENGWKGSVPCRWCPLRQLNSRCLLYLLGFRHGYERCNFNDICVFVFPSIFPHSLAPRPLLHICCFISFRNLLCVSV